MPNFFDKERFVIYYENLKLYLRQGLKLKKIHSAFVVQFNQSLWLKPYTEFSTQKKTEAEKIMTKMEKHCTN